MLVIVDNTQYYVKWHHNKEAKFPKCGTRCEIIIPGPGMLVADDIIVGRSYVSKKDQFNADKGRKVSLQRALQQFSKDNRLPFWEAYFKMRHENH
jgi:hypothetical protein